MANELREKLEARSLFNRFEKFNKEHEPDFVLIMEALNSKGSLADIVAIMEEFRKKSAEHQSCWECFVPQIQGQLEFLSLDRLVPDHLTPISTGLVKLTKVRGLIEQAISQTTEVEAMETFSKDLESAMSDWPKCSQPWLNWQDFLEKPPESVELSEMDEEMMKDMEKQREVLNNYLSFTAKTLQENREKAEAYIAGQKALLQSLLDSAKNGLTTRSCAKDAAKTAGELQRKLESFKKTTYIRLSTNKEAEKRIESYSAWLKKVYNALTDSTSNETRSEALSEGQELKTILYKDGNKDKDAKKDEDGEDGIKNRDMMEEDIPPEE
jgi:hypothetical protein